MLGKTRRGPVVLQIEPYNVFMYSFEEQVGLQTRFAQFFMSLRAPVRLIAYSRHFNVAAASDELTAETAATTEPWRAYVLDAYRRFLEQLVASIKLKSTQCFLIGWGKDTGEQDALANSARQVFTLDESHNIVAVVEEATLPMLFPHDMMEEADCLAPVREGEDAEYVALLLSRDMKGDVDFFTPLLGILAQQYSVAVAVDVETIPRERANTQLTMAYNRLTAQLGTAETKDVESESAYRDVQFAMEAVQGGEGLHRVQIAVAVFAPSRKELQRAVRDIKTAGTPQLQLRTVYGEQGKAAAFFSTTPTQRTGVSGQRPRNTLSTGCAAYFGSALGFRQRDTVSGVLLGIEMDGGYPVFHDIWTETSYSGVVLGQAGSGKTFWANQFLSRQAARGVQIIFLDPQGNCERLADLCEGSYNQLSFEQGLQLNPLDVIYSAPAAQQAHVFRFLEALLGRRLTNLEKHAVGTGLRTLYSGLDRRDPSPELACRLENLHGFLLETADGHQLARELDQYVTGELGAVFNAPTNVDLALAAPVVAYDVQFVEEEYQPLVMTLLLGNLSRQIMAHPDVNRLVFVDEFGILIQGVLAESAGGAQMSESPQLVANRAVALAVMSLIKRMRRFRTGIWVCDQNPSTFHTNVYGKQILQNARHKVLFHQAQEAIGEIAEMFGQLTQHHLNVLAGARQGENITLLGDRDTYHLFAEASPLELEAFSGT